MYKVQELNVDFSLIPRTVGCSHGICRPRWMRSLTIAATPGLSTHYLTEERMPTAYNNVFSRPALTVYQLLTSLQCQHDGILLDLTTLLQGTKRHLSLDAIPRRSYRQTGSRFAAQRVAELTSDHTLVSLRMRQRRARFPRTSSPA